MVAAHWRQANLVYTHLPRPGPRRDQPRAAGWRPAGLRRPERAGDAMTTERIKTIALDGDKRPPAGDALAVFRSLDEIPAGFGPTVAAGGNFDGVHLGHRAILAAAEAEERNTGARSVAITFDPHPEQFLRPARAPRLITPLPERLRLLGETGIDAALVLTFDAPLAALSPRAV